MANRSLLSFPSSAWECSLRSSAPHARRLLLPPDLCITPLEGMPIDRHIRPWVVNRSFTSCNRLKLVPLGMGVNPRSGWHFGKSPRTRFARSSGPKGPAGSVLGFWALLHRAILLEGNGIARLLDRMGEEVSPYVVPRGSGENNPVGAAAVVVHVDMGDQPT